MKFVATLERHGKTATGIVVPPEVVDQLGGGRRPAVRVAFRGHAYASTVAPRGDRYLVPVSAEQRNATGAQAGDELEIEITLDLEPRTIEVPDELARALAAHPEAAHFFDGLTASQQKGFVTPITAAKTPETRQRRIANAVEALREGRKR
jgi:hypothetical protein